ncbi:hypothetical protein BCO19218_01666 [Burkholderia contaminans]|nr:hypothetical protein BCO19218_01666 [Burkholderia contaminans]
MATFGTAARSNADSQIASRGRFASPSTQHASASASVSPRLRYTCPTALSSFDGIVFGGARVLSSVAGDGVALVSGAASSVCDGQASGRGCECGRAVVRRRALETDAWCRGDIGGA